jgi:hypothetical protein
MFVFLYRTDSPMPLRPQQLVPTRIRGSWFGLTATISGLWDIDVQRPIFIAFLYAHMHIQVKVSFDPKMLKIGNGRDEVWDTIRFACTGRTLT